MPARSVAFANLRGGCGKSTILFQLASEFAKVRGAGVADAFFLFFFLFFFGSPFLSREFGRWSHALLAAFERHVCGRSPRQPIPPSALTNPPHRPMPPLAFWPSTAPPLGTSPRLPRVGGSPTSRRQWASATQTASPPPT